MNETDYKISHDRLRELLLSEAELTLLMCAGVDSWEGAEYAYDGSCGETLSDAEKQIDKDLRQWEQV